MLYCLWSNKQSFSRLLHCVRGGPCVVIYWMVKTDSGSILVNALCYKYQTNIIHHFITSLFSVLIITLSTETQSSSKRIVLFFILKQKLKAGGWGLIVDFSLSHMRSFSLLLSNLYLEQPLSKPRRVVFLILQKLFEQFQSLCPFEWWPALLAGRGLNPPALGLCSQLSSRPDPTEEQRRAAVQLGEIWQSFLIPGMSKALSQRVNEMPPPATVL